MLSSDRQCIEQCLNGHPDEYGQLVRRYQAAVLSFLVGRMSNRESAEEAAQETFVRAYFKLNKLNKPESFFSWLLGIAGHVANEQLRLQKRQQVLARISAARPAAPEFSGDYALEQEVARLPDPLRQVVLLRYYGGLSCTQIAEQSGVPLGTVTKRLSRAYGRLRELLGQHDGEHTTGEVRS